MTAPGTGAIPRAFLDDEFLLESDVAQDLYHRFAESLPIIDYHSHLPPEQLAEDILKREQRIIELMAEIKGMLRKKS